MNLSFKKSFVKQIKLLSNDSRANVLEIVEILKNANKLEDTGLDYVKMSGQKKKSNYYYRIRTGTYRIGIQYIHPDVIVFCVLSRGDVYKSFPPK